MTDTAMKPRSMTSHQWTNPSVRKFAGTSDPISVISDRARATVRDAIQAGWKGPPFDPSGLAELLRIPTVPSEDVVEAQIVPSNSGFKIEFNPNRARARIRFSIAHEIAHTLFPDCSEETRKRGEHGTGRGDAWQLELLCNLAASEFLMPTGRELDAQAPVSVDNLIQFQAKFDVSMEAVALRLARTSLVPFTVVVAARVDDAPDEHRYRVDYSVASRSSTLGFQRGAIIDSVVFSQCSAVGFTSKETQPTSRGPRKIRWECVGLPPYKGQVYPRVLGLATPDRLSAAHAASLVTVYGDALARRNDVPTILAQIVNDKTPTWGAGFSRVVSQRHPGAQEDFRAWCQASHRNLKLGNLHLSQLGEEFWIASLVAQHGFGPSDEPRIRYSALEAALGKLADEARSRHAVVQMPRIGSGYAGGNWGYIVELIDQKLARGDVEVTIVALPGSDDVGFPERREWTQRTLLE